MKNKKFNKKDFFNKFDTKKEELLILVSDYLGSLKDDCYVVPAVEFVASIDLKTGNISNEKGRVEWLTKDNPKRIGYKYNFEKYKVYKIKARKIKQKQLEPYMMKSMNNCYLVLKVLEKNVQNEYLNNLAIKLALPIELKIDKYKFLLNRRFCWFETNQNILGQNIDIYLRCDEDVDTANKAEEKFKSIISQIKQINDKISQRIVDELINLVNEYRKDKPLSKQEFKNLISINNISFNNDGTIEFYYNDGDEFGGHEIQVKMNKNDEIISIDIVG